MAANSKWFIVHPPKKGAGPLGRRLIFLFRGVADCHWRVLFGRISRRQAHIE